MLRSTVLWAVLIATTLGGLGWLHFIRSTGRLLTEVEFTAVASADDAPKPAPPDSTPKLARWWSIAAQADPAQASFESVLGPGGATAWSADSTLYEIKTDPLDGRRLLAVRPDKALALTGLTTYKAGVDVHALVRLRTGTAAAAAATIVVGQKNNAEGKPENMALTLRRGAKDNSVACSVTQSPLPFHDRPALAKNRHWDDVGASDSFTYMLWAYPQAMPGWETDFRARVEADMASLPGAEQKWIDVRIELRKGLVRFCVDDRLLAWRQEETLNPEGTVTLQLSAGVELAGVRVDPTQPTPGFLPIPLGGYVNAKQFVKQSEVAAGSLPPAGNVAEVDGVPFVFPGTTPDGHDHIDVGRSYLRQANVPGYLASMYGNLPRWRGAVERDPGRIQLRIPNGQYDALYFVAASDGDADEIPRLSAMFYRPGAGYPVVVEAAVPEALAADAPDMQALPVQLSGGQAANLWLIKVPLDPGQLSSLADMDVVEIELAKTVEPYRTYPDPINYSFHQAGRPSAVHVFAATLGYVPVGLQWNPDVFGHVWTAPAEPAYTATVTNHTGEAQSGKLTVSTRSYDGTEVTRQEKAVTLAPRAADKGDPQKIAVAVPVKRFGYHDITATLEIAGRTWVEKRSLVKLAPDTRSAKWTEGRGAMFGYWSYPGGHYTPKAQYHSDLMTLAGARQTEHTPALVTEAMKAHWGRGQSTAYYISPQPWAAEDQHKPEDISKFQEDIEKAFVQWEKNTPDEFKPDVVNYFTESHISPRLSAGNFPEYWQDPPFNYTAEETKRLRMFMETARIASEYLRKTRPDRKLMIEWGSPVFVVPLLRAGFSKALIDGSSIDMPLFERLPEMQLADNVLHQLYELKEEYKKYGMPQPRLQYCEGAFVPTEPGAVSYREQMDIYHRWTLLSMAYGVDRFYAGWFAFDCGNYYGSEHYGGCGIQRRIPYCDPKPAYAAYATMTDKLNEANFDGWLPTGSLSTFCLRFKKTDGKLVYALWTVRGNRPVAISAESPTAKAVVTDSMNNAHDVNLHPGAEGVCSAEIMTDPSVIYVSINDGTTAIKAINVSDPNNANAQPGRLTFGSPNESREPAPKPAVVTEVADLGDGSWHFTGERDLLYENNHWGYYPAAGKFTAQVASDPEKGKVLVSKLEPQGRARELMPWYNVLRPAKPVEIAGAADRVGLWVKGASDWGRVIYVLRDAGGERWMSIGAKDDYNCNDVHAWSSFNFDGWRYVRFELPGHEGYDNYRKFGTNWWRSGAPLGIGAPGGEGEPQIKILDEPGDQVVDLPLSVEAILIEQRTHVVYVNDVQPVSSDTVLLGKMMVEYDQAASATPEAVRISKLRMPAPKDPPNLPNPIAELAATAELPATKLTKLTPPEHYYDGTRMHVHFDEAPQAAKYFVWVSAHADGRGAVNLSPAGITPGGLIMGLRPGVKLYYWITYADAAGKTSQPSNRHEEVTIDNFKEK